MLCLLYSYLPCGVNGLGTDRLRSPLYWKSVAPSALSTLTSSNVGNAIL